MALAILEHRFAGGALLRGREPGGARWYPGAVVQRRRCIPLVFSSDLRRLLAQSYLSISFKLVKVLSR